MKDGRDIQILTMEDCLPEMLTGLRQGQEKGSTTHITQIDNCWRWRRKEFSLWTGYQNEGKSQAIRYLSIIKAITDKWNFIFTAPEDYPAASFFDDMIHTMTGQSTDKDNPNYVSERKYLAAYEILKNHFTFVYLKPPENTIKNVVDIFEEIIAKKDIHATIIDPLIKFARPKDVSERDDIYAAYVTTLMTDFCRNNNVSAHLVMHQLTPKTMDNGLYPKPSPYSIKGGGSWSDGVDNVLFIQRPEYARDKMETKVLFGSQKIKRHKLVAIPQEFLMRFDRRSNQYTDESGNPLFDFTKYLK